MRAPIPVRLALQAALVGKLHHAAALDAVAPLSEARARLLPKLSARLRDERFAVAMVRVRVRVRVMVKVRVRVTCRTMLHSLR